MTARRDPDRLIRAFLDEGPTELPDRTYEAVRDHIDRTRQRVVLGPWREPHMSNFARVAIVTAAVVVAAVVGINLLPRGGTLVGSGLSPSPRPTISPSQSPVPSPPAYMWPGTLEPGTYSTDFAFDLPVAITFTVPDGWTSRDINIVKGERLSLKALVVDNLYVDPCGPVLREPPTGPTVDDLAAALATMPGLDASTPTAATLGGVAGKYLEYTLRSDLDCAPDNARILRLGPLVCDAGCGGLGGQDVGVEFAVAGALNRTWVLDAGGRLRVVIQAESSPDASQADLDELQAVIASIRIDRIVPATPAPQPASSDR